VVINLAHPAIGPSVALPPLPIGAIMAPMKRMNLRDVPDEVYLALAEGAEANRQSLNAFVVERLTEVVQMLGIAGYVESYEPPHGTGVTLDDAAAAVRDVRDAP
jgi:hypothetical protein